MGQYRVEVRVRVLECNETEGIKPTRLENGSFGIVISEAHAVRDGAEITSPTMHLIFRPSLPDLQAQNPRNRSDYSYRFALSDRTNLT